MNLLKKNTWGIEGTAKKIGKNAVFFGMMLSVPFLFSKQVLAHNVGTETPKKSPPAGQTVEKDQLNKGEKYVEWAAAWATKEQLENAFYFYGEAAKSGMPSALLAMGRLQLKNRMYSAAINSILDYLKACPDSRPGWVALLGAYVEIGDKTSAQKCLKEIIFSTKVCSSEDWKIMADAYMLLGNERMAMQFEKKAKTAHKKEKRMKSKENDEPLANGIPGGKMGKLASQLEAAFKHGNMHKMKKLCGMIASLAESMAGKEPVEQMLDWMISFKGTFVKAHGAAPAWLNDTCFELAGSVVGD